MLSDHIEDFITALKAKPNGLWRNKALSHAHDLLAAVSMLEMEKYQTENQSGLTEPLTRPKANMPCTCRAGMFDSTCPAHHSA